MPISSDYKPLLAIEHTKVKSLDFPFIASPKLDGIRCVVFGGVAYSRSLKPIRNAFIQEMMAKHADVLEGLDGELIVGSPTDPNAMQNTSSGVMSIDGKPDFTFFVFDYVDPYICYETRLFAIMQSKFNLPKFCTVLKTQEIWNEDQLLQYEQECLSQGYEGVMLRNPEGKYKYGRSGKVNPELIKVKRFTDAEFEVVGYECLYTNQNEAQINELGHTQRSTAKDGLLPVDILGKLICRTPEGVDFGVGSGYTQKMRAALWQQKEKLIGLLAKVKYFEVGVKDAPRFPVFVGFRDKDDL